MVASVTDRASQRPKTATGQRDFQTHSATGLRGHENTEGSRHVMATCSPRVGILLAGARQASLRRWNIE